MVMKKERNKSNNKNKTYTIAVCGVLTALAMIFSYIESMIQIPVPIPGIKLGIANIAIITVLYVVGWREASVINVIRISLTSILFGNINTFIFSMAGGILSMFMMILLMKTKQFSMAGVSVAGGVAHNIGQIIAAIFVMGSSAIVYYLPVLMISGIVTGVVIGVVAALVTKRVRAGISGNGK